MDDDRIIVASNLHGSMTPVTGRYLLRGDGYQITSDASLRSGGPGVEASPLDLLVASLVSCALNAFRTDLLPGDGAGREVEIYARVERDLSERSLGTLILECFLEREDSVTAELLVEEYTRRCRIYRALRPSLPVRFVMHTGDERW